MQHKDNRQLDKFTNPKEADAYRANLLKPTRCPGTRSGHVLPQSILSSDAPLLNIKAISNLKSAPTSLVNLWPLVTTHLLLLRIHQNILNIRLFSIILGSWSYKL